MVVGREGSARHLPQATPAVGKPGPVDGSSARVRAEAMAAGLRAEAADRLTRLQALTLAERGEMLRAACRTAAVIAESRAGCGLPPVEPAPWPDSTWDFLAACARRVRDKTNPPPFPDPSSAVKDA